MLQLKTHLLILQKASTYLPNTYRGGKCILPPPWFHTGFFQFGLKIVQLVFTQQTFIENYDELDNYIVTDVLVDLRFII